MCISFGSSCLRSYNKKRLNLDDVLCKVHRRIPARTAPLTCHGVALDLVYLIQRRSAALIKFPLYLSRIVPWPSPLASRPRHARELVIIHLLVEDEAKKLTDDNVNANEGA